MCTHPHEVAGVGVRPGGLVDVLLGTEEGGSLLLLFHPHHGHVPEEGDTKWVRVPSHTKLLRRKRSTAKTRVIAAEFAPLVTHG